MAYAPTWGRREGASLGNVDCQSDCERRRFIKLIYCRKSLLEKWLRVFVFGELRVRRVDVI